MPSDGDAQPAAAPPTRSEPLPVTLWAGFGLFVVSFFLPAVDSDLGINCAFMALWVSTFDSGVGYRLAFFGALINPMVLAYFVLRIRHRLRAVRICLAVAILICIPLTWVSLAYIALPVQIGHYVWIAGILLVLWPTRHRLPTAEDLLWALPAVVLVVGVWWSIRLTLASEPATDRDTFFANVATGLGAPGICSKINPRAQGRGTGLSQGLVSHTTFLQEDCYRAVSEGKAFDPGNGSAFVHFMQLAGCDDERVAAFMCREDRNKECVSSAQAVYERLRKERKFLDRVEAAHTYDELRTRANIRPAYALEYLYQMVAVDNNIPRLCGKISPNAAFRDFTATPTSLRSRCYSTLAFNQCDAGLCAQLPRLDTFALTRQEDSREACEAAVAACRQPGGGDSWPVPKGSIFRDADCRNAIRELGYRDSYVPVLTSDDYWDYVRALQAPENRAERAEFVGQVLALK